MFTRFIAKAMLVPVALVAAAANAAPAADSEGVSRTVSYADLDLSSQKGAATLERRIRLAANSICGAGQRAPISMMAKANECRDAAIASAEPQVQIVLAQAARGERYASASDAVITLAGN
ncbi:UrcA family protein [Sphingomonas jatrophae]|uniref:UrcA family protein n=1 Tax=Sphingomonas jatrophae TaxID=1166337 RepID=A0A1I6LCI5_9SPHN|nr:UrcA family protein [Sphingomonas jatrophae]SFS01192.1 UrcA family protein [Sphingomonas jatrophae]